MRKGGRGQKPAAPAQGGSACAASARAVQALLRGGHRLRAHRAVARCQDGRQVFQESPQAGLLAAGPGLDVDLAAGEELCEYGP